MGTQDPRDKEAGMDAVASSTGTAIAAVDGGRPLLPKGHPARLASLVSAGRRRDAAEEAGPSAVGLPSEAAAPTVSRNLFRREGEYWTVCYEGEVVRLRDAKGLGHLARLLAAPGREFHVVDLEAANRQTRSPQGLGPGGRGGAGELWVRPDLGDAGALLDATAKAAYRARLGELGAELEEAEADNDPTRAARARAEREFLVAELARAVGLGGRDRRAAAHAERARLNATRAIRPAGPDHLAALTGWVLRALGLNDRAPGLHAISGGEDPEGRRRGARSRGP